MHQVCVVLQMYRASQIDVAPRMRARDPLTGRVMAKVFAMKVLLQVAAAMEGLQAGLGGQCFTTETKDAISGFAFDRDKVGKTRQVEDQ